jgi:hypothetical protein
MYYNICPIELRKYDYPTYHMSLLRQHLTHQEEGSAGSSMCGSLMFEEAIHLQYDTVTGQVVSNNSKGSNSLDWPGFILR